MYNITNLKITNNKPVSPLDPLSPVSPLSPFKTMNLKEEVGINQSCTSQHWLCA